MAWEQRWHPLREEWVVVSGHRDNRPWLGDVADSNADPIPLHSPSCYLCPQNTRINGHKNPPYDSIYVFHNDCPCLSPTAPVDLLPPAGIYINSPAKGHCRIMAYNPIHNMALPTLPFSAILDICHEWQRQFKELSAKPDAKSILIFETRGDNTGNTNPHPCCQIYAPNFVFKTLEIETEVSRRHLMETGHVLFQDIISAEEEEGKRILDKNEEAISFLPYFARLPYETFVAPRKTYASIDQIPEAELISVASLLHSALIRLDNLWRMALPYILILHNAPTDGRNTDGFHFYFQIHPPMRKPTLMKFLAGPEIGGGNITNDTTPEAKAAELQNLSGTIHYTRPSS